jgi:hypothetical protein
VDIKSIIAELEAKRDQLSDAISALQGGQKSRRPSGKTGNGRKRHLTAAQKKRIGAAMKKRWAERKKSAAT